MVSLGDGCLLLYIISTVVVGGGVVGNHHFWYRVYISYRHSVRTF